MQHTPFLGRHTPHILEARILSTTATLCALPRSRPTKIARSERYAGLYPGNPLFPRATQYVCYVLSCN